MVRSLNMRVRILENEKRDAEEAQKDTERKLRACERAQDLLREEEDVAVEELRRAEASLELVRRHVSQQDAKRRDLVASLEDSKARQHLVARTIDGIKKELDKVVLLAEATAQ